MFKIALSVLLVATLAASVSRRPGPPPSPAPPETIGYGPERATPIHYRPLDLAGLAREAEAIVVADVRSTGCRWSADHSLIWTDARLLVRDCWKGNRAGELVISEPGGEIPPYGVRVTGAVRYEPGSRVVVFVTRDPLGQSRTLGSIQGRFPIGPARSGERMDLRPVPRPTVARFFPGENAEAPGASPSLAAFKAVVTALVTEGEGH